jgi:polyisoprenoid-binding protein YceI
MKKRICFSVVAALLLLMGTNSMAAAPRWKIDRPHANIYFSIHHIYATIQGRFTDFDGVIEFDPANLKESRFDFKVRVDSIDTHESKRDEHLQTSAFFDADKYPEMTFKSKSILHKTGNQYEVDGVLTIKDVSKDVKVPFTYLGSRKNPLNPKLIVAGFEAHMDIDRLAYHVGSGQFYEMGAVGKKVKVLISMEADREE